MGKKRPFNILFDADVSEWGIGISIGSTEWSEYCYYVCIQFLCFYLMVHFWGRQKEALNG